MSRLRSYARISDRSAKVEAGAEAFTEVYRQVDQRSEGRCEVWTHDLVTPNRRATVRCPRGGVDHHHLFKPRRSNHTTGQVILACRICHDRMDWPYPRGRLCFVGTVGVVFLFAIRYASDKFIARGGA